MLQMAKNEQECWARVKDRLRSSVGDDVYNSWFARVDLEQLNSEAVHMSVPTRFLKSWIQTHYAERVLGCWQEELPNLNRIELTVRTPMRNVAPAIEVTLARYNEFRTLEEETKSLSEKLETRKVVERAKGLLMEKQGLSEQEAFRKIQKASMNNRKSMREVAEAILLTNEM